MPFQVHGRRRRPSQMWHGVVHSSTLPMNAPSPSLVLEAFLKGMASALHIPHLVHVIIRCTSTSTANTTTRGETYLQKSTPCLQAVPWHATSCLDRVSQPVLVASTRVVVFSVSTLSRPIPTRGPSSCPLAGLLSLVSSPRPRSKVSCVGNFVGRAADRLLLCPYLGQFLKHTHHHASLRLWFYRPLEPNSFSLSISKHQHLNPSRRSKYSQPAAYGCCASAGFFAERGTQKDKS